MKKFSLSKVLIHLFFWLMCLVIIIPFVLIIAISFSNEKDIAMYGYQFVPKTFDLNAYRYVFKNPRTIINAYAITSFSAIVGTTLSVILMSMVAYPLTKKDLKGKTFITFYIFFTMLFNGGLAPTYMLITRYLNLDDTVLVYILPGLVNAWHIILLRTFFAKIPEEIVESALLDGASEIRIFITMILPLSKPALATVALFGVLARWNDWFTAMLYINRDELVTLQYLLQRILLNIQMLQQQKTGMTITILTDIPSETMRMAMAVVAAGPMLLVFPFFQKYFVQGLTVGSVKG